MNQSVIRRPSKVLGLSILCVCVLYAGAMLLNMESFLFGRLQYKIAEPLVSSLLLIGVLAMSFLFGKYGGKRYVIILSAYLGISMAATLTTSIMQLASQSIAWYVWLLPAIMVWIPVYGVFHFFRDFYWLLVLLPVFYGANIGLLKAGKRCGKHEKG